MLEKNEKQISTYFALPEIAFNRIISLEEAALLQKPL